MEDKKDVVLVIGSSGCLGQFIVKHLQENDENVEEIRLYDRWPYKNNLDHAVTKKMVEFINDIRNPTVLREAMTGVDVVIHVAAVMDFRQRPDIKYMEAVNIEGTQHVITVCLEKNVSRLIFASSTSVVCGTKSIFHGDEFTTSIPESFLIGKYGETKYRAEQYVLEANGKFCSDYLTHLKTISLRLTPLYGENDRHFVYKFLKYARMTYGYHQRVISYNQRLQATYVGNAAYAFIKAKNKLKVVATVSGEAFFITDDTPTDNIHDVVEPYIRAQGYKPSRIYYPHFFAWFILSIVHFFIRVIDVVFVPFEVDIPSTDLLHYICSTFYFTRYQAELRLGYVPFYSPAEAKDRSLIYYRNVRVHTAGP